MICASTGLVGDNVQKDYSNNSNVKNNPMILHRKFKVKFSSDVDPELGWEFEPVQDELVVNAGEPALMFYRVKNNSDKPIVGIS